MPRSALTDVLFVDLPFNSYELGRRFKSVWSYKQFLSAHELHLGFRYMTAYLRHRGYQAGILYPSPSNGLTSKSALIRAIEQARPLLLGLTSYEGSLRESLQFVQRVKARGNSPVICMGGHLATFSYEEILRDFPKLVDVIVLGDGEETIAELAEAVREGRGFEKIPGIAYSLNGAVVKTPQRPIQQNIDSLPFPVLDTDDWQDRSVPLFLTSSRGCYGRCSFCRSSHFGERWRAREPRNVADEIERAVERGVTTFEMVDDNFLGPGRAGKERALAVASEILRRGLRIRFHISCRVNDVDESTMCALKEAGLISVSLGVESGVQRILDTFNKNIKVEQSLAALDILHTLDLPALVYIIFFDPYTTLEEAGENIRFLEHIRSLGNVRFEEILFRKLIPISGTDLFERIRADGLLRGDYLSGHRFAFRDRRVSWLADFLETIDLRFERMMQREDFRRIGGLYGVKEVLEFAVVEKSIGVLRSAPWKKSEALALMEDILSAQLRRLLMPVGTNISPDLTKGAMQYV